MKKIFIISVTTLFLTACTSDVAKLQKFDSGTQYSSEQAVIIIKVSNFDYLDISRVERVAALDIKKVETPVSREVDLHSADPDRRVDQINKLDLRKIFAKNNEEGAATQTTRKTIAANDYRVIKPRRLFAYSYTESMYTIEPGIYFISFLATEFGNNMYYSEAPGLNKAGEVIYGAFDIKAGEVLYLGDIECQWKSSNKIKKISVLNELSSVKKDLVAAGHMHLASKIELAQFYPYGSRVSQNAEGKYILTK